MSTLSIEKQGVRGCPTKEEKAGYISVYSDNNRILSVNNYLGYGKTYHERPEPIITIFDGTEGPNETAIFEGTQSDLIKIIKKGKI